VRADRHAMFAAEHPTQILCHHFVSEIASRSGVEAMIEEFHDPQDPAGALRGDVVATGS